jgi:peptide/nickel transport system substrate-binding protein
MKPVKLCFYLFNLLLLGLPFGHADIKNPDTFILASYGPVNTLDPAASYSASGAQRIGNIYETLVFFEGSHTDRFVPVLAEEIPTTTNGGVSADGKTYTFKIRKNVKFQEGGDLTPEDVVYSIKRNMIVDPDGGPMWMLLEALTGKTGTRDEKGKVVPGIFTTIDQAITANGDQVLFHLPRPFPPFMGILAHSSSVVLDKEWAVSNGCWDGDISSAAGSNNPAPGYEPLQNIANGTNAYRLKLWEPSKQFVFERFEGYWGGKPAMKKAIVKYVKEWTTRKLMLQNGDADRVTVDTPYYSEIEAMPGLKLFKVPQLSFSCALFCQKIDPTGNPNIGSGKLDGKGIPPDFFADIDVRKAFLHAFDRELYGEDVLIGTAVIPTSPNIQGLPYHQDVPIYPFDLQKTAQYLKTARGGEVWNKGFKMVIAHNTGNEMREAAALIMAENIMSLNPKFQIEVRNVDWKDYVVQYRSYSYPIFITGWVADYADPHNFLYTFMHSQGVFGRYLAYQNREVDDLCTAGIATVKPAERENIYARLQQLWYEQALGLPLYQTVNLRVYKDYVHGFVPNPLLPDSWEDLKRLRKE